MSADTSVGSTMNIARKMGVLVAAATMSLGLLSISAPAEAKDTSWGCGGRCRTAP